MEAPPKIRVPLGDDAVGYPGKGSKKRAMLRILSCMAKVIEIVPVVHILAAHAKKRYQKDGSTEVCEKWLHYLMPLTFLRRKAPRAKHREQSTKMYP